MTRRALALASHPAAEQAAREQLRAGGSAISSALAGFFASAGALPGVLFSPFTLLIGGIGIGARAFDGRLRQPGLGMRRPRGFRELEEVPMGARVAVPGAPIAAVVAQAYTPGTPLAALVRPGVVEAKRAGALRRVKVLSELARAGARFLLAPDVERSLLEVGGPGAGGILTRTDLGAAHAIDVPAVKRRHAGTILLEPAWCREPVERPLGEPHACLAVDARGACAALYFENTPVGVTLPELELELPLAATPVARGVARRRPGSALPSGAPLVLVLDEHAVPVEALADLRANAADARRTAGLRILRSAEGNVEPARSGARGPLGYSD